MIDYKTLYEKELVRRQKCDAALSTRMANQKDAEKALGEARNLYRLYRTTLEANRIPLPPLPVVTAQVPSRRTSAPGRPTPYSRSSAPARPYQAPRSPDYGPNAEGEAKSAATDALSSYMIVGEPYDWSAAPSASSAPSPPVLPTFAEAPVAGGGGGGGGSAPSSIRIVDVVTQEGEYTPTSPPRSPPRSSSAAPPGSPDYSALYEQSELENRYDEWDMPHYRPRSYDYRGRDHRSMSPRSYGYPSHGY